MTLLAQRFRQAGRTPVPSGCKVFHSGGSGRLKKLQLRSYYLSKKIAALHGFVRYKVVGLGPSDDFPPKFRQFLARRRSVFKLILDHGISPIVGSECFVEQPVCHDQIFKSFSFAELSAHNSLFPATTVGNSVFHLYTDGGMKVWKSRPGEKARDVQAKISTPESRWVGVPIILRGTTQALMQNCIGSCNSACDGAGSVGAGNARRAEILLP